MITAAMISDAWRVSPAERAICAEWLRKMRASNPAAARLVRRRCIKSGHGVIGLLFLIK